MGTDNELRYIFFLIDFIKYKLSKVFKDVQIRGGFFHFRLCIWRKIQPVPGSTRQIYLKCSLCLKCITVNGFSIYTDTWFRLLWHYFFFIIIKHNFIMFIYVLYIILYLFIYLYKINGREPFNNERKTLIYKLAQYVKK
jgi:hypothetical protein